MTTSQRNRLIGFWCGFAILGALSVPSEAAVRNVCQSGCAYGTIQSAIDPAAAGDTVLVHDGVYVERINFLGKAITVRSVNGPGATAIDGDKKGSVVTFTGGEGAGSVLSGFTLINGSSAHGGGILCGGSSPVISDCAISGNWASTGGGIYCSNASPSIRDCIIAGNEANNEGGGIACTDGSAPIISGCTIVGNSSSDGGGVFCRDSSPTILRCTISGNTASSGGGGILCDASAPSISACTISGNRAFDGGAGVALNGSSPRIGNCVISGNSAGTGWGGGLSCGSSSSPSVVNCTVSGNKAGIGGGLHCGEGAPSIANSIVWGNLATIVGSEIHLDPAGASASVAYSDVLGGYVGTGNIDADPIFRDGRAYTEAPTAAGDYRLSSGSPCIDMGTNDTMTYPSIPAYDLAGDPRPQGSGYDMGSDEFALLANGSFEEAAERVPVPWRGTNLARGDGRVVSEAHGGGASFLINGSAAAKQLRQTISLAGPAGDRFEVSCWSRAYRTSTAGGPFGVVLTVSHRDGTQSNHYLGFPRGTHSWRQRRGSFTARKAYRRITVSLVCAGQTGRAWFDDVTLSVRKP